jgi:diacylglycerol kinase
MDYTQTDYALQARPSVLQNVVAGLRRVFTSDPLLILQVLLIFPVITAGILLHINALQWILIGIVILLFLVASIFRTASLLQVNYDTSLTEFHVTRIKCMGNILVVITSGIALFTCMMVFVPRITLFL